MSWINHLPPAYWSTFWKSIFKQQLGCRFDIMDSISSFLCILTYAIIYVLIHHIIFWLYLYFLNIPYFFKYSCINIPHRRSPCTFYKVIHMENIARMHWIFFLISGRSVFHNHTIVGYDRQIKIIICKQTQSAMI